MSDTAYSPQFIELLLRHIMLSPAVFNKAVSLGVKPDDFLPPGAYQLPTYQILASLAFEIGVGPVDPRLVEVLVSMRAAQGQIPPHIAQQIHEMLPRIFDPSTPVMEAFFLEELVKFIRAKRAAKIISEAAGDVDRIRQEYEKVIFPLDTLNNVDVPVADLFVRPFAEILKKSSHAMISTGFPKLNAHLGGGIGYREFGLVVGHSGGGKTALGTSIARGAALAGHKVVYCSMEESKEDIANRMYAAVFKVDYTSLHNGSGYMELDQKAASGDEAEKRKILTENLMILDLKGYTPLKPSRLKNLLDEYAKTHGFIFELVVIDQLQFMEPEHVEPGEQEWIKEGRVAKEVDEMSHQPIGEGSSNYFGVWLLHQAKGKVKIYFSTDEIAGFKGIVHKPETVLGIGRENPASDNFEVFSLKNRHAKGFRLPMHGDLTYMTFIEKAEGSGDAAPPPAPVQTLMSGQSQNFGLSSLPQLLSPPITDSGPPRPPAIATFGT